MIITDLFEETNTGLYVCATFTAETCQKLTAFCVENEIPHPLPTNEFHSTIIYSKAPIHWRCNEAIGQTVKAVGWDVWTTKAGSPVLVLHIDSPYLRQRFKTAMARGGTHDFPSYNPHVSLTYDATGVDKAKLPLPEFPLVLDKEIARPLKP